MTNPDSLIPEVRRLRDEHGWGNRKIGATLTIDGVPIGKDAALRLLKKAALEDAQRQAQAVAIIPVSEVSIEPQTAAEYAERIAATWQKSVQAILETGHWIARAKEALEHGEFGSMIANDLPFGSRTAQMLMQIAADERLANAKHVSLLPPHWGTLYELHKLDDERFYAKIDDGTIRPDMERREIATERKQQQRQVRERVLGGIQCAMPETKAGVILEDFEWDHQVWSDKTGSDRHASNHYPTSKTAHAPEEIVERTRERFTVGAPDCVLFMWTPGPHLFIALKVMELRGFDYKSHYVWGKDKVGTGYWNRNKHEVLLIGVRGNIPCPAPGTQWDSLIEAPVQEHSRKPDCFLEMIEAYFPTLPKIELNARRSRPGWIPWGNEAPHDSEIGDDLPLPTNSESEAA